MVFGFLLVTPDIHIYSLYEPRQHHIQQRIHNSCFINTILIEIIQLAFFRARLFLRLNMPTFMPDLIMFVASPRFVLLHFSFELDFVCMWYFILCYISMGYNKTQVQTFYFKML